MKLIVPAFFILTVLAAPAAAQTVLNLSASGEVLAPPDQVVASLTVQANAPAAGRAQNAVNEAMAKALAAARALPGVTAATQDYSVQDTSPKQNGTQFQASQTLQLTMPAPGGVPPTPFSDLLGRLQAQNLQLNGLDGGLSAAGRQKAQDQATTVAIRQLQDEGAGIAKTLGQKVEVIKTLNVSTGGAGPVVPMRMMAMAAPSAAPPQAAPGPVLVSASVSAEIALAPN